MLSSIDNEDLARLSQLVARRITRQPDDIQDAVCAALVREAQVEACMELSCKFAAWVIQWSGAAREVGGWRVEATLLDLARWLHQSPGRVRQLLLALHSRHSIRLASTADLEVAGHHESFTFIVPSLRELRRRWRVMRRFPDRRRLRSLLARSATGMLLRSVERETLGPLAPVELIDAPSPSLSCPDLHHDLCNGLAELSPESRDLLCRRLLAGETALEAAAAHGISESTLRRRLRAARHNLGLRFGHGEHR